MSKQLIGNGERPEQALVSAFRVLRVWPVFLLLVAMVALRYIPSRIEDGPARLWMMAAIGPLLGSVLIIVWWLVASRARWQERAFGFLGIVVSLVVVLTRVHPSIWGPAVMTVTIPMGIAAFGIGTMVCARMLNYRRTIIALVLATCGFAFSTLLRAEGLWGDFTVEFHWRWQESSEERMLARHENSQSGLLNELPVEDLEKALLAPEWPGFRGADRNGRQRGTRFATNWATNAPQQLWKIAVGPAWSSFVVAGDLLFTQEQRGAADSVICYDAKSGREVWTQQVESRFDDPLGGPGPRATPTLTDGNLFVMGAQGFLTRLNPKTGAVVWMQDLQKAANRKPPMWGFSSSPLVSNDVVIVHAGGAGDKGVLAFDIQTGKLRWSAASSEHSYSSPHPLELQGEELVGILTDAGLNLLDPTTGKERFNCPWTIQGYRALQPQLVDGNTLLIPTGMGFGTRLVRIAKTGESFSTNEVWTSLNLKPDFNDFVVYQGHLYGFDGAIFTCLSLENGERRWKGGRYGKGQVLLLEDSGLLLIASEQGDVALVKADPAAHTELAKIKMIDGKTWNHPVVVGDRLYVRNAQEAACYRLPLASSSADESESFVGQFLDRTFVHLHVSTSDSSEQKGIFRATGVYPSVSTNSRNASRTLVTGVSTP